MIQKILGKTLLFTSLLLLAACAGKITRQPSETDIATKYYSASGKILLNRNGQKFSGKCVIKSNPHSWQLSVYSSFDHLLLVVTIDQTKLAIDNRHQKKFQLYDLVNEPHPPIMPLKFKQLRNMLFGIAEQAKRSDSKVWWQLSAEDKEFLVELTNFKLVDNISMPYRISMDGDSLSWTIAITKLNFPTNLPIKISKILLDNQ